jgi:hypothetical protein
MYELAEVENDSPRPNLVVVQKRKKVETLKLVRCPECKGLRGVTARREAIAGRCFECQHGRVVTRDTFWAWWQERYTMEEIEKMAEAIWE